MNRKQKRLIGETVFLLICICIIIFAIFLFITHKKTDNIGKLVILQKSSISHELSPYKVEHVEGKKVTRLSERKNPVNIDEIVEISYSADMVTSITTLVSREPLPSGGAYIQTETADDVEEIVQTTTAFDTVLVSSETKITITGSYAGSVEYTIYDALGTEIRTETELVFDADEETHEPFFVRASVKWGNDDDYILTDYFFKCVFS